MIFELFVSSARICAYTSETPGACAVAGSATRIKQHNNSAQTLAISPPNPFTVLALRSQPHVNIHSPRFAGNQRAKKNGELLADVFLYVHGVFGAVDVASGVCGETFGASGICRGIVGGGVGGEIFHGAVFGAADANAAAAARIVAIARFALARLGIGDVDHIVLINVDSARAAELFPLGDEMAVLVKDLDAVVLAVANEQAALGVEGQGVWAIKFADGRSFFAPGLEELAVGIEFHDAGVGVGLLAMTVGDEDVAIG